MSDINTDDIKKQIAAACEGWKRVEQILRDALGQGGILTAQLNLPGGGIRDRFMNSNYNMLSRYYSVAHVTVSSYPRTITVRFGVRGANGVFFPRPNANDAKQLIDGMGDWRALAVWMGGAQSFLVAFLTNAVRATDVDDLAFDGLLSKHARSRP